MEERITNKGVYYANAMAEEQRKNAGRRPIKRRRRF